MKKCDCKGWKKPLCILWKITKWVLIVVAALVVLTLSGAMGPIIQWTAPVAAKCMGADLKLEKCVILPLGGYVRIAGLRLENPTSFREKNAEVYEKNALAQVGNLEFDFAMKSLFGSEYVIDKIELTGLRALYAFDYKTTNVDALLAEMGLDAEDADEVKEEVEEEAEEVEEEAEEAKEEVNIRIKHLKLADNSITLRKNINIPVALPPMEMTDVSSRELIEQLQKVLTPVIKTIKTFCDGIGAELSKGMAASTEKLNEGLDATKAAAQQSVDATKAAAQQSVDATKEAMTKSLDATKESLGEGVEALEKGAEETLNNLKGIFNK
jgi:F0F1-type ATP synthase membrane subunit b/b'